VAYTVEVIDTVTGCQYSDVIPPIDGFSPLDVVAGSTPGFCDVNRNGEITYTISGFTVGSNLQIELVNNDDASQTIIETITPGSDPYVNSHVALPGDYQILVTNLTDTCTDAVGVIIPQNLPSIDVIAEEPANCNADGQIVVQGAGGAGGPYEFAFMTTGNIPGVTDWTTNTAFSAPADTLPPPTFIVNNQCAVASPSFAIEVSIPSSIDTPRFTLGGESQFGVLNGGGTAYEYTFTVGTPGDYIVDVIDANGCTSQGTAVVYEFLSASGGFTTDSTCNDADGIITILPLGGSGDFDFELTGTDYSGSGVTINQTNNAVFTSMLPGDYQVVVTDRIVTEPME